MSSTAAPRSPLRTSVVLVWRTLRSMRTALILLLMLALASVAGSLLPQLPNSPERVGAYLVDHPIVGDLLWRAGLFDVFGSWWFVLITTLLFTSLLACLVPRSRAALRAIRQRPVQARELDAFPQYREIRVATPPTAAIDAARRVLRRRRFRLAVDPDTSAIAAEKGALREAGSLMFHWAFVLLLLGVIVGKGTGYAGRAVIVEGSSWTDARINYDGEIRTGRFFRESFTGLQIELQSFEDRYRDSGVPMDFVSTLELTAADGAPLGTQDVRVNHPVSAEGLSIFQYGFGWAPVVDVWTSGDPLRGGAVVMSQDVAPAGVSQLAMPWHGFVKLPTLRPQVAVELELYPDSRALFRSLQTGIPQPMVVAFEPVMRYTVWRGKLLDPSQSSLDTRFMRRGPSGFVGHGQSIDVLRGCVLRGATELEAVASTECPAGAPGPRLSFADLRQYSVLQVSRDAGVPVVFLAAILIVLGLLPALYTARRKVWVRAEPDGERERTVLRVGGFALQRKQQFEEEFARLVGALTAATDGEPAMGSRGTSHSTGQETDQSEQRSEKAEKAKKAEEKVAP
jgi:cytochrome c biogenesis protein